LQPTFELNNRSIEGYFPVCDWYSPFFRGILNSEINQNDTL
jgi:hypothetical protein